MDAFQKTLCTALLTLFGSLSFSQTSLPNNGSVFIWLVGNQPFIRKDPECSMVKSTPNPPYIFNSLNAVYIVGKDSFPVTKMEVLMEWSSLAAKQTDPMEYEGWFYPDSSNLAVSGFFRYFNAMPSILSVWVKSIGLKDGAIIDFPQMKCFNSTKTAFKKSIVSSELINAETERRKQRPVENSVQWVVESNDSLIYYRNGVFFYHR